jgi:hypothetical protein
MKWTARTLVQFRHSCSLVLERYICSTKSIELQISKCYRTKQGPVSLIHGQFPQNECVKFLLVSSLVRNRDRLAINKYLRTGEFVLSTDKNAVTDNVTCEKSTQTNVTQFRNPLFIQFC